MHLIAYHVTKGVHLLATDEQVWRFLYNSSYIVRNFPFLNKLEKLSNRAFSLGQTLCWNPEVLHRGVSFQEEGIKNSEGLIKFENVTKTFISIMMVAWLGCFCFFFFFGKVESVKSYSSKCFYRQTHAEIWKHTPNELGMFWMFYFSVECSTGAL